MSFNPKTAADELLKLADFIDKEASEKTVFSCEKCNHTASLSSINAARSEFAKKQATELNVEIDARPVTVNDKVACANCGSHMSYEPTAESERFYIESAEDSLADLDLDFGSDEDKKDKPKKDKKENKDEEPVAEEPAAEEPPKKEAPKEEPPKEAPAEEAPEAEEPAKEESPKEEPKKDKAPEEDPPEEDIFEPVDEQAVKQEKAKEEEEVKKKKAPKKEEKDDKPAPKFEKMPKEASDRFIQKLAKYSL